MGKKEVKRGDNFGRLLVVKFHNRDNYKSYWECACDCKGDYSYPNSIIVRENDLLSGNTRSCGCLRKEMYKRMRKNKEVNNEK